MIPCLPLMSTIAPTDKPTKANSAKDREQVERRLAKLKAAKEKRAKRLAKIMQVGEEKQLTAEEFFVEEDTGPSNIVVLLNVRALPGRLSALSVP